MKDRIDIQSEGAVEPSAPIATVSAWPYKAYPRDGRMERRDAMLHLLIGALASEIAAGLPAGKVFVDGIATALCAYLAKQYSVIGPRAEPPAQGLDQARLRRVIDHISTHLSANLTVPDLAFVACLSPYHFGKAFKLSMGETVHGYVLRRRIARAKDLIKEGRTSLAEVATAVGFADQSHFTAVFRRQIGVTPKAFARQIGQRNRG